MCCWACTSITSNYIWCKNVQQVTGSTAQRLDRNRVQSIFAAGQSQAVVAGGCDSECPQFGLAGRVWSHCGGDLCAMGVAHPAAARAQLVLLHTKLSRPSVCCLLNAARSCSLPRA